MVAVPVPVRWALTSLANSPLTKSKERSALAADGQGRVTRVGTQKKTKKTGEVFFSRMAGREETPRESQKRKVWT